MALSEGRAFVLFTSYQQMMAAYERLSEDLPYPCLVQSRTAGSVSANANIAMPI